MSGQSWDVLSILGFLVLKDQGCRTFHCRDNPWMSSVSQDVHRAISYFVDGGYLPIKVPYDHPLNVLAPLRCHPEQLIVG